MDKVHFLIGDEDDVLHVFESKIDATQCAIACEAHERRRPTGEDVTVLDAAFERWAKRHPGGRNGWLCHRFTVATRSVRPARRRSAS